MGTNLQIVSLSWLHWRCDSLPFLHLCGILMSFAGCFKVPSNPFVSVILYLACKSAKTEWVMSCSAAEALVVEGMVQGTGWDHSHGRTALGAPIQPARPSTSPSGGCCGSALLRLARRGGAAPPCPRGLHGGLWSSSMQLSFPWLNFKHSYLCYFPSHTP